MINNKAENIIGLGIITIVFLLAFSVILSQQIVSAQQKQASSSGNVTAQVAPQGTHQKVLQLHRTIHLVHLPVM
jgi:hypothetical protein